MRGARGEHTAPLLAARWQDLRPPALALVEPEQQPDVAKRRQVFERVLEIVTGKKLDRAGFGLRRVRLPRRLHLLREWRTHDADRREREASLFGHRQGCVGLISCTGSGVFSTGTGSPESGASSA